MSAVLNAAEQPFAIPIVPVDVAMLDTGHGTVSYVVAELRVHGVKVNIRTEVSGSGGGITVRGTGSSHMSIESKSYTVREFWLSPIAGGRDVRQELVDSDFAVADGQTVLGLYSQAADAPPDLVAIVNMNTGEGYRIGDLASNKLHERYVTQFLGKNRGLGFSTWLLFLAAIGGSAWVWSHTTWKIGVPLLIGTLFGADWVVRHVPFMRTKLINAETRDKATKSLVAGQYRALKWLDSTVHPTWVA